MVKNTEFVSVILIMGLPIILAYLLVIIRVFERRFVHLEHFEHREHRISFFSYTLIDVRDAALVTLALDFAEIIKAFSPPNLINLSENIHRDFLLIFVLIIFHMSTLFMGLTFRRRELSETSYLKSSTFNRMLQLYLALVILLTNAVTIKGIMGAM